MYILLFLASLYNHLYVLKMPRQLFFVSHVETIFCRFCYNLFWKFLKLTCMHPFGWRVLANSATMFHLCLNAYKSTQYLKSLNFWNKNPKYILSYYRYRFYFFFLSSVTKQLQLGGWKVIFFLAVRRRFSEMAQFVFCNILQIW